jgi:membrane protein YdbS with pleckstrin-like domain
MLKKGSAHMQVIIAGIALLGAVGIIIFLSYVNISAAVKVPLVALLVLIAVYSLARIPPKETNSGKDTGK